MSSPIIDNPFSDPYKKNILDDGTIDSGVLLFSRPYNFSLSGNYSSTSQNIFLHSYDQEIYPPSLSTATGFSVFATATNSSSGYYYMALMKLFNFRAIADYRGTFSITSITASTSSALYNAGKVDPNFLGGTNVTLSSFSASITSLYYYHFGREVIGDRILDGTLTLNNGLSLMAKEPYVAKDAPILSLTSTLYQDSYSAVTRFWVFPDTGELILWSSSGGTLQALSAVSNIQFSNSVAISNITINALLQPEEFNSSANRSFYSRSFADGNTPDTCFSTLIFYNPWGQALATCQIPRTMRKSTVPLDAKIILDIL